MIFCIAGQSVHAPTHIPDAPPATHRFHRGILRADARIPET